MIHISNLNHLEVATEMSNVYGGARVPSVGIRQGANASLRNSIGAAIANNINVVTNVPINIRVF
jgi:hypothetical protein